MMKKLIYLPIFILLLVQSGTGQAQEPLELFIPENPIAVTVDGDPSDWEVAIQLQDTPREFNAWATWYQDHIYLLYEINIPIDMILEIYGLIDNGDLFPFNTNDSIMICEPQRDISDIVQIADTLCSIYGYTGRYQFCELIGVVEAAVGVLGKDPETSTIYFEMQIPHFLSPDDHTYLALGLVSVDEKEFYTPIYDATKVPPLPQTAKPTSLPTATSTTPTHTSEVDVELTIIPTDEYVVVTPFDEQEWLPFVYGLCGWECCLPPLVLLALVLFFWYWFIGSKQRIPPPPKFKPIKPPPFKITRLNVPPVLPPPVPPGRGKCPPELVRKEMSICFDALSEFDQKVSLLQQTEDMLYDCRKRLSGILRDVLYWDTSVGFIAGSLKVEEEIYGDVKEFQKWAGYVLLLRKLVKKGLEKGTELAADEIAKEGSKAIGQEILKNLSENVKNVLEIKDWAMREMVIGLSKIVTGKDPVGDARRRRRKLNNWSRISKGKCKGVYWDLASQLNPKLPVAANKEIPSMLSNIIGLGVTHIVAIMIPSHDPAATMP